MKNLHKEIIVIGKAGFSRKMENAKMDNCSLSYNFQQIHCSLGNDRKFSRGFVGTDLDRSRYPTLCRRVKLSLLAVLRKVLEQVQIRGYMVSGKKIRERFSFKNIPEEEKERRRRMTTNTVLMLLGAAVALLLASPINTLNT
jgi:hypothetical protein